MLDYYCKGSSCRAAKADSPPIIVTPFARPMLLSTLRTSPSLALNHKARWLQEVKALASQRDKMCIPDSPGNEVRIGKE